MNPISDHAADDSQPSPKAPLPFLMRLLYTQSFSLGAVLSATAMFMLVDFVFPPHHPSYHAFWWVGCTLLVASGISQGIIAYRTPAGPSAFIPRSAPKAFWVGIIFPIRMFSGTGPFAAKSTPDPKRSCRRSAG